MRVVFIHGTGAPGHSAWRAMAPDRQPPEDVRFLGRIPPEDAVGEAVRQAITALEDGGHVVAASYGGLAGLRVAEAVPELVTSLTLFEPAAFAIARGRPGVEAHLDVVEPIAARQRDHTATVEDFAPWAALAIDKPLAEVPERVLHKVVAEMRVSTPPWQVPVDPGVAGRVPTLVVTGGWDARYEEVAEVLAGQGARHVVLRGHRHRVQDHPQTLGIVRAFWNQHLS